MDQILKTPANHSLPGALETEKIDNRDDLLAKYIVKPLTPNISDRNFALCNNGNGKTVREELLARLSCTVRKLNQYERNGDKNRRAEASCLDGEDDFTPEAKALPENVEETVKGIVQSAQEYVTKLNYQLKDLDNADQQIENNMMKTVKDVDRTFQSLLDDVCREINKRRERLILEAEIYKAENLIPLRACRRELEARIQDARNIVSTGKNLLRDPGQYDPGKLCGIIASSNDIGRIPAVPYSEELPTINFDRPSSSHSEEIIEQISRLGHISRAVPVQITNIEERPGGLFVKWHVTNPEYTAEEQTFVVEMARGEIPDPASSRFETAYRGSDNFCSLRNIPVNQPVTLRVRIQVDNVATSVHHVARTSIPPYSWEFENADYAITNNGRIAAKLTDAASTLFSRGAQFDANHIIEFKFLEVSQEGSDDEGIALVYDPQGRDTTLRRPGSLTITSQGKIFMDGEEKLMRLSKMRPGTEIVVSARRKNAHVLRVNIESENKCVTYDWRVQTPLYFAARFKECNKWNVLVK